MNDDGPPGVKSTVTSPKVTGPQLLNLPNIEKLEEKIFQKRNSFFQKKIGKNFFLKKIRKFFLENLFQLQVATPNAHPVQISSRSD